MRKTGIVVNQQKKGALELLGRLRTWLEERGVSVVDTVSDPGMESWVESSELIICLGGDGTLLSAAGKTQHFPVPILGVNLGSLGFLTEVRQEEVFEELENFREGRSEIEERLMLSCLAESSKQGVRRDFRALNDVVISREGLTRLLELNVEVNGELLTGFSGDGLIIASPTGSTAYSLSAGGAVIHPKISAIMVTPICPHTLSLRPLVLPGGDTITVQMRTSRRNDPKALLTVDGQGNLEIDESFTVRVTRSEVPVRLVKSSKRGYLETLRENFSFPT